jgi:hypothetical protein
MQRMFAAMPVARRPLEKFRPPSIFRERRRVRDTHDTRAQQTGNLRNGAEKFRTKRSLVVHELRDFSRLLVISY